MSRHLGASTTTAQDAAIGAAIGTIVPGVGNAVGGAIGSLYGIVAGIFAGGAQVNATRQAQVTYFTAAALKGSPVAVQFILGGILNCVKSEVAMFNAGAATVQAQAPDVWADGVAAGPLWYATSFPAMAAAVNANLAALAAAAESGAAVSTTLAGLGTLNPVLLLGSVVVGGLILWEVFE